MDFSRTKTSTARIENSKVNMSSGDQTNITNHYTFNGENMNRVYQILLIIRPARFQRNTRLLSQLNPTVERSHYFVAKCMDGTRTDVMTEIQRWIENTDCPNIFWLKGSPGAGKSAIAATIGYQLRDAERLGSSFFLKSGHATLSDAVNVWRTVAFDLTKFDPNLETKIIDVLRRRRIDPSVPDIKGHFHYLIQEPLIGCLASLSRYPVVIIDAADECVTDGPHLAMLKFDSELRFEPEPP
jgi:hypothetical protein